MDQFVVPWPVRVLFLLTSLPEAGRLHNVVCSACHNPDDLLLCETCCRSYHGSCLPPSDAPGSPANFHCPFCKRKRWDRFPPQSTVSASVSDAPRSNTLSERGVGMLASPSSHVAASNQTSPGTNENSMPGVQVSPVQPFSDTDQLRNNQVQDSISQSAELCARAKEFLSEYGGFPQGQEYRQGFLLQLGWMMKEVESHQMLFHEVQNLREENARLQNENSQLRGGYQPPRIPTEAMLAVSSRANSPIPRPPSDAAGKSWDSIVLDLI